MLEIERDSSMTPFPTSPEIFRRTTSHNLSPSIYYIIMEISKSKIIDILDNLEEAASFDQIIAEYKQRHGIDIEGDCFQVFLFKLSRKKRKELKGLSFDIWFRDYLLSIPGIEVDVVDNVYRVKYNGSEWRKFTCELCEAEYTNEYDLKQHKKSKEHIEQTKIAMNRKVGEGKYDCKLCSVKCDDKAALTKHKESIKHRKNCLTGIFDCKVCGIGHKTVDSLQEHMDGKKHKEKVAAIAMDPDALYEPSRQLEEELVSIVRAYGPIELDLVMRIYTSRFERRLRKSLKELVMYMPRLDLDLELFGEEEKLVLSKAEKEKVTAALFSKKKSKKKYKMKTINNDA